MLVLNRKVGERIVVPGFGLTLTVLQIRGKQVRLGIAAPAGVTVYREEVQRRLDAEATAGPQSGA